MRSFAIAELRKDVVLYCTSMHCAMVPQPCDGRCWKTPTLSWSPQSSAFTCDSIHAVSNVASSTRSDTLRVSTTLYTADSVAGSALLGMVAQSRGTTAARRPDTA